MYSLIQMKVKLPTELQNDASPAYATTLKAPKKCVVRDRMVVHHSAEAFPIIFIITEALSLENVA